MKQEKFLTVFAVFDNDTQIKLKKLQDSVLKLGFEGSQTMDIPFHISLGSFPVECAENLIAKIKTVCSQEISFEIRLDKINHFNNSVLFIEPTVNTQLQNLHCVFDNNFADGFPWHAHTTIFCGATEQVSAAKEVLTNIFRPFNAKIIGIQLGEFFPTKTLVAEKFRN